MDENWDLTMQRVSLSYRELSVHLPLNGEGISTFHIHALTDIGSNEILSRLSLT